MAKILIAEHELETLKSLKGVLEREGHQVSDVRTGTYAMRMAMLAAFDVVILSGEMPDVNSVDLVKALQVLPERPKVLLTYRNPLTTETAAAMQSCGIACVPSGRLESLLGGLNALL